MLNVAFPARFAKAGISGPTASFYNQGLASPDKRFCLSEIAQLDVSVGDHTLHVEKPTFGSLDIRFTRCLQQNLQRLLGIAHRAVLKDQPLSQTTEVAHVDGALAELDRFFTIGDPFLELAQIPMCLTTVVVEARKI